MNITIKTDIDVQAILRSRGLGSSSDAWQYAGERFKHYCKDYVPWDSGTLANTADVNATSSGATVKYNQPYAHYQYYGQAMGPSFLTDNGWRSYKGRKKSYTGKPLSYASGRSKEWDKRMMAARGQQLYEDIANYVGGHVK